MHLDPNRIVRAAGIDPFAGTIALAGCLAVVLLAVTIASCFLDRPSGPHAVYAPDGGIGPVEQESIRRMQALEWKARAADGDPRERAYWQGMAERIRNQ